MTVAATAVAMATVTPITAMEEAAATAIAMTAMAIAVAMATATPMIAMEVAAATATQ